MSKTRIQRRGVCIYCGKLHALTASDTMVAHGYEVEWHQQVGNCSGVGKVHAGHEDAPALMQQIIDSLKVRLAQLPEKIANLRGICEKTEKSGITNANGNDYRKLVKKIRGMESLLSVLPSDIESRELALKNWKPVDPVLVDLDVEETEQRKEREAKAKTKKAEKAAKEAAKEQARLEREAKAQEKHVKYIEQLNAGVFVQVFFNGALVKEVNRSFVDEHEMSEVISSAMRDIWGDKGDGFPFDANAVCSFLYDVRTKPDGKGAAIYTFNPLGGSRKKYFDRFNKN